MPDLLLELRSEEIPARMQRKAGGDLRQLVTDGLVAAGLTCEAARAYWTPRRLVLDVRGLTARSRDVIEERKGPSTKAPETAVQGFLKSAGLASLAEAEIRSDPRKGEFYVARLARPGRPAEAILAELLPEVIRTFPWPKSMRWGAASARPGALRWVRPLQSILCTFGPETEEPIVVDFEVDGIRSGNVTFGHRFHAPGPIVVRRFDDFVAKLEAAKVVLDADRRKAIVLSDAQNLVFAGGMELIEDEALLEEVAGLVEWPVVLVGDFNPDFLEIPAEVIRLTIRANQKCFVCAAGDGAAGRLADHFVLVANIAARDGGAEIVRGNGKVVRARLADALYFWRTDQADLPDLARLADLAKRFDLDLGKPLDQRMARLDRLEVTFHARLGTQGERVSRIRRLAAALAPALSADPALVDRAAVLAKADLQTEIVGEFPELQGVMGGKYAALQGEAPEVAAAIEAHYRPQGPADRVPDGPVPTVLALADKLDMLESFWAIDEKPTGSKDPFALRRAALGVIRMLIEGGVRLSLRAHGVDADLLAFFHERLKVYLRDKGARHDLIDAVITPEADDLVTIVQRVEALARFLASEDGANLLAGTKRAANILAAEEKKRTPVARAVDPALFAEGAETTLLRAVDAAERDAASAAGREDFAAAMLALSALRRPVDAFFDEVLVNVEDPAVRANRLALLGRIRTATGRVADFSRIAG